MYETLLKDSLSVPAWFNGEQLDLDSCTVQSRTHARSVCAYEAVNRFTQ